jgi:Zn-dependent peptidase ImmA (M78 family)/DNA-binding XRE family transcriptional regulator
MVKVEANPTPSVLVWAREVAGLAPDAAARKVGISPERLLAWESGQQRPTFAQLRKLATVYRRPLAVFYLEGPPKRFAPMQDFRRSAEAGGLPNSPDLVLEIRKAHDRRGWALELFEQIEERPPEVLLPGPLGRDPEVAAEEVRHLLNVEIKSQMTWRADYDAFKQWRSLIEKAGILTFQATEVESTEVRGFSISDQPLPVAVANIKDAPRGRIFTLLHEVVHILLNNAGICDLHETGTSERSRVEAFCNHVAGAVLFPKDDLLRSEAVVRHRRGSSVWADQELAELSRSFGGSREAALVRLLTLGLTTQAYYEEKREVFLKRYAEQRERDRQKGGFAPPLEVALTSAGPTFTSLVVENFNRERITASDVSDYLQIRLKHLADVQRDYSKLAI